MGFFSKTKIESIIIRGNRLTVNDRIIDTSEFQGQPLNVEQVNGKLIVNGKVYNFKTKTFKKKSILGW